MSFGYSDSVDIQWNMYQRFGDGSIGVPVWSWSPFSVQYYIEHELHNGFGSVLVPMFVVSVIRVVVGIAVAVRVAAVTEVAIRNIVLDSVLFILLITLALAVTSNVKSNAMSSRIGQTHMYDMHDNVSPIHPVLFRMALDPSWDTLHAL